jgi:ubiquinone/menaquinone biosynthesis C-methylase UbiE
MFGNDENGRNSLTALQDITSHHEYQQSRKEHWDTVALMLDRWRGLGGSYHKRLKEVYQFLVAPGQSVIEIGCGQGDLLAALNPSLGVGVDFSSEMVKRATNRHAGFEFILADAHSLELDRKFDIIILSDLVNDVWDVQAVLEKIAQLAKPSTRIILNYYSRVWEIPLEIAQRLKLAKPTLRQNWLTTEDIYNLFDLVGLEAIRHWEEILLPLPIPLLNRLFNRLLVKIWPFNLFALTNFIVARPEAQEEFHRESSSVSVIVPARNEAGNIPLIFERVPEMGEGTELVFIEGHSNDGTYAAIEKAMADNPGRKSKLLKQIGEGKGDAVRQGFQEATGDILMILDADLTVPPEDLPRFFEALIGGKGEFVNGVRLVYPMEEEAMRFFNLVGNKFFSVTFSWLLGQRIKDTLCGTKVLSRVLYERIAANRSYFGDFDPFGDFDLLLGAVKQNLKIVEIPIRYHQRTYGETNIQRWKHGWLLLRMAVIAALRLKFV